MTIPTLMEPIKVLTANIDKPNSTSIDVYIDGGGYEAARKALQMAPDAIVQLVKDSELRGRGGAGFPTGSKWGFVPKNAPKPTYLLCNADESEPGTFKDRVLIEKDPHLLIEGMIIAGFAIGSNPMAYIYIRGEFYYGATVLEKALAEAREKGFLGKGIFGTNFDFDITVARGAGAYICGEETGLIESIEGHRGQPRVKPPFPAVVGAFGGPTVVQNVETLACVPLIVKNGAEWFKGFGTPRNTGPKLYCVSGNVKKPGVYEFPMGITIKELIYDHCGGITADRKLKAVIPGGASAPMLTPDEIDLPLNFDALMKAGSMLGSAGIIVLDEIGLHRRRRLASREVLRPRVMRPVHAVPRGDELAGVRPRPPRARRRTPAGRRPPPRHVRQHRRQVPLRPRRRRHRPRHLERQEVPRRVPLPRRAQDAASRRRSATAASTCRSRAH